MLAQIEDTHIREITNDVCQSFVGVELSSPDTETIRAGDFAWAQIAYEDETKTNLSLAIGFEAAKHMASTMFQIPADELEEPDVLDAIGEIANILGGNLKKKSEVSCGMSTPTIEMRSEIPAEVSGQDKPATEFCCAGHLFLVHLSPKTTSES